GDVRHAIEWRVTDPSGLNQSRPCERQTANAWPAQLGDGIGYARSQRRHARLANAAGLFGARHDVHFDLRHLMDAQRPIGVEVALNRAACLELDFAVVERT